MEIADNVSMAEMQPGGESYKDYQSRVGEVALSAYYRVLAAYRRRLATERGLTEEELHLGRAQETADEPDLN